MLPAHLADRTRPVSPHAPRPAGRYVVYWMRAALRAHENPALDVALAAARALGVPAFVYHAVSERYPYASDRLHRFILEGARDVAAECAARGIGYVFHCERPGHRGPHLRTLARDAALVVTEDVPVAPLRQWTDRLAASVDAPVWAIDTACLVPMRVTTRAFDRAFAFRDATAKERRARLAANALGWPDVAPPSPPFLPDLPFAPVDLATTDLAALVAECDIDHGVGPVPHTRGGTRAGYARWDEFREQRLRRYAKVRNDALRPDGVSRMSAYLHFGMVSPFRLIREAQDTGGDGAEKFLDELLVWRELAWHFCFHRPDHDTLAAVPPWARATLRDHEDDPREVLSDETLARGRAGDALWDAAQQSLLIHGELHNNVRMTWGKAIPLWSADAAQSLARLIDLNHRYALDGRDPSSYGGLLWCLGQFDRPFAPEQPVLGTVRPRDTREHARRLDVRAYAAHTGRPAHKAPPRVAVIGAGIAGLACARALVDHAWEVVVFDKGRAPGGRLATRRTGDWRFDHGAQYAAVRDARFAHAVDSWTHDGVVAAWSPDGLRDDGTPRIVGTPSMRSLAAHLAADVDVRSGVRIEGITRDGGSWRLATDEGRDLGAFDRVVVAVPAPQAVPLLSAVPRLAARAAQAQYDPCWAVMVAFAGRVQAAGDVVRPRHGALAWAARDASKPGRAAAETWVLHASASWSRAELERQPDEVVTPLLDALAAECGAALPVPLHVEAHRWRHALVTTPLGQDALYDPASGLGACGDWCLGPRVESAWLSGIAMAGRLLGDYE